MGSHRFDEGGIFPAGEPERVAAPRTLPPSPVVPWWSAWIPVFAGIVIGAIVGAALITTVLS